MLGGIIEKQNDEITLKVSDQLWGEHTIWSLDICDFLFSLYPLNLHQTENPEGGKSLTALCKQVFLPPFHLRYALGCFHSPYEARVGKVGLVSCSFRGQKTILVSAQGKWVFPHLDSPRWSFGFNCSRPLITKRAGSLGSYQSELPGVTLLILL